MGWKEKRKRRRAFIKFMQTSHFTVTHFTLNINKRPLRHYGFYIHLVRLILVSWNSPGWAGQGSYGIYMGQEYFLNNPIQRKRDFGGQQYFIKNSISSLRFKWCVPKTRVHKS